jgi:hypothetical protein
LENRGQEKLITKARKLENTKKGRKVYETLFFCAFAVDGFDLVSEILE